MDNLMNRESEMPGILSSDSAEEAEASE